MKEYFIKECNNVSQFDITDDQIKEYRELLVIEMIKMGADEREINLISIQLIINSLINNRNPEDVAWAILQ